MGKIRRPKNKPHQNKVAENETESLELSLDSAKENVVQTILDQLQGPSVEEKYCGLQTLAQFVANSENISQVIEHEVVKSAAPLLFDGASSVRNAAAGALRNLSTVSLDTCESMIQQDVMTPLVAYFHEYAEKWVPLPEKDRKKDDDTDTFIQCVNLLWNLCESSEIAIKYFNQSRILSILSKCLDILTFGKEIIISVLQCLFVVTEDNTLAIEKVKLECEEKLEKLCMLEGSEPYVMLVKTLSAGIVMNIFGGKILELPELAINRIMTILSDTLTVDHRKVCNDLTNSIPVDIKEKENDDRKSTEMIELDVVIESVNHLLEAQQCSVEILANLCSAEDSEDSSCVDYSSESDEVEDNVSLEEIQNGDVGSLDRLPTELIEAIAALDLLSKVWARATLPAQNVVMILEELESTRPLCKKLRNLQSRALLCVNNMLTSLPLEMLGGAAGIYKVWLDTGKLVFGQTSANNVVLVESATAVMRSALDRLKSATRDESLFAELTASDVEMMLTGTNQCEVSEVRANLLRALGTLALLLFGRQDELVANITHALIAHAHKESEVWVLAEIVDAIMDLYAEDETDLLASKVKLVDKLTALNPILKNKARQSRKQLGEHAGIVHTAVTNLPRFIKYKRTRVAKLQG